MHRPDMCPCEWENRLKHCEAETIMSGLSYSRNIGISRLYRKCDTKIDLVAVEIAKIQC